ncbi:GNAT family N-acetyltransferase [Tuwongella immobilis]|uniref:N-acetyltransferase domain-containing protein n=1 Tax=Tuwongella immobilis TaxID=692036 RepID=A0A6C2YKP4_9BACT|nr:GNAT family N-acetyltransferase [Tuwongella immobilis]VIP01482.1 gcn5 family acetyltransferase : Uncharacterized protein OS=Pseudoalteromonas tunicata D2 GN=PTD2_01226 PE=4 SV=1: Acetyltransf_1 [Tuwongella immobilis]VTR98538.1 gcn5 family acetyltransferase : Uncharacterized protein OS=Pseudoalteromonas tunicata D2 GN=PTD2_01226 PE=4 SV=1: Acetyltransf_1 [Tuwongella immobilis]
MSEQPELVEVTDLSLLPAIGRLRVRAWQTELSQPPTMESWLDDWDATARHWAFLLAGQPVAAARMTIHDSLETLPDAPVYAGIFPEPPPGPIASLNRLVVDPAFRRGGMGTALDRIRIAAAEAAGCRSIVGSSSADRRIAQLQSHGFIIVGRQNKNPQPIYRERGLQAVLWLPLPREQS